MLRITLVVITWTLVCQSQSFGQIPQAPPGDWPWWRGPNFNGTTEAGQAPPLEFSESQNVIWRTPVPGRGHASPCVSGDHVYLSTADEQSQQQAVVAFDRKTGSQLWLTVLSKGGFPKTHAKNTHATPTVACDGDRLFVSFHHHDKLQLFALDRQGKKLWDQVVGAYIPKIYEYGYAPSPLIYGKNVIVAADYEKGGYLAAYDRASGQKAWRAARPLSYSFSSPVVTTINGKDQLLLSGCGLVTATDPRNGKDLWGVKGTTMATCGTMVWEGDLVIASGGYPDPQTICVKADGSKQVMWTNQIKCYEQSLLAHKGHVYAFSDQGLAICWRASDGQEMWKQRLVGPVSSSPILCDDRIYATNELGTTYVFRASPDKFERLAENRLGNEGFATLAICGGRIYVRAASGEGASRQETLYCFGK